MKMYEMNQITLLAIFEIKTWFAYLFKYHGFVTIGTGGF